MKRSKDLKRAFGEVKGVRPESNPSSDKTNDHGNLPILSIVAQAKREARTDECLRIPGVPASIEPNNDRQVD